MDKSKALERLTALESEAAELRKIIEQPEVEPAQPQLGQPMMELPEIGERYFYIATCGTVYPSEFAGTPSGGTKRFSVGNVYSSQESAEIASERSRLEQRERIAAAESWQDVGEVIDWKNHQQHKHCAGWDFDCIFTYLRQALCDACRTYFPSEDSLNEFIESLTEREQQILYRGY